MNKYKKICYYRLPVNGFFFCYRQVHSIKYVWMYHVPNIILLFIVYKVCAARDNRSSILSVTRTRNVFSGIKYLSIVYKFSLAALSVSPD